MCWCANTYFYRALALPSCSQFLITYVHHFGAVRIYNKNCLFYIFILWPPLYMGVAFLSVCGNFLSVCGSLLYVWQWALSAVVYLIYIYVLSVRGWLYGILHISPPPPSTCGCGDIYYLPLYIGAPLLLLPLVVISPIAFYLLEAGVVRPPPPPGVLLLPSSS